jgi:hypothetical protein
MLFRQGDIYVERISAVPVGAARLPHLVLADGELTGHRHRIDGGTGAVLYELRDERFLEVVAEEVKLIHDEHGTIPLERGIYRVWRQREFDPTPHPRHGFLVDRAFADPFRFVKD